MPIIYDRSLGGPGGLASLVFLLFQSLVARKALSEPDNDAFTSSETIFMLKTEWEYVFSLSVSERHPCITWLSSLVILLQRIGREKVCLKMIMELLFSAQFISQSLQSPELALSLKLKDNYNAVQVRILFLIFFFHYLGFFSVVFTGRYIHISVVCGIQFLFCVF